MTSTLGNNTTLDAFLGGKVALEQPAKGYRAGVDPVLLASAVPAITGQSVLELGCGTGAALFCLAARVPGLDLHAVEVQARYADLARANAARNGVAAAVHTADLRDLPDALKAATFDHVIANPPYFQRSSGNASDQPDRDTAFGGDTPLADWIEVATRRLKPKGWLTCIQKAHRMPDVLRAMDGRLGTITITPIAGRNGRPADRFLLWTRKGGAAPFRLTAPAILHRGEIHEADAEDYSIEITQVLRNGAAFPRPD